MSDFKYEEESNNSPNSLDYTGNESLLYEPASTSTTLAHPAPFPEPRLNLLDGTFFQYLADKSSPNRIVALCVKCMPREVEVRGFGNCSSNFLSHLKRRHGESTVEEYKKYIKCKRSRGATKHSNNDRKSTALPQTFEHSTNKQSNEFDENILKFFISSMVPTSAVESPYFSKMFVDLNLTDVQIPTQQCLEQKIRKEYANELAAIKQMLSEQDYICTTVIVYSGEKRSILCITAHWISPELRRHSVALACRSIKRRNIETGGISQIVQEIYSDFELSTNRVVGTIIGHSDNYVHAFRTFGIQLTNVLMNAELELEDCVSFDADDLQFNNEAPQDSAYNRNSILENCYLPAQLKCCTDLLSTVLVQVINEELYYCNNTPLSNLHMAIMNKCNILWEAAGHAKLAEVIVFQLGKNFTRPTYTSWKSLFTALQEIVATKDKSFQLHKALNLQNPLTEAEFNYLQEYLMCTAPIAEALDILQAEKNSYYGIVMPCLFALRRNLLSIAGKTILMYCQTLINIYVERVSTTFAEFYDVNSDVSQNAAIAALSFPRFKNHWLVCVEAAQQEEILRVFTTVLSKEMNVNHFTESQSISFGHSQQESAFFNFGEDLETENSKTLLRRSLNAPYVKAEAQILQFFAEESTDLSILENYPELKKVFIRYNTPMPSLALGKSLFPMSSIEDLRLNPKAFNPLYEKRLILKAYMDLYRM